MLKTTREKNELANKNWFEDTEIQELWWYFLALSTSL